MNILVRQKETISFFCIYIKINYKLKIMGIKRERTIKIDKACSYIKLLKAKIENGEETEMLRQARKSKMAFKNQINDLEDFIDSLLDTVDVAKVTLPLDANKILDAEDDITLAELRLKKAKELYKELFNEEA